MRLSTAEKGAGAPLVLLGEGHRGLRWSRKGVLGMGHSQPLQGRSKAEDGSLGGFSVWSKVNLKCKDQKQQVGSGFIGTAEFKPKGLEPQGRALHGSCGLGHIGRENSLEDAQRPDI